MEGLKRTTKRKLKHAEKRAKELKKAHGATPGKTHTYHGGWDLGYWEGRASMAQDILDEVGGVNMKFGIYLDGELIAEREDIFEAYKEAVYATTVLGVPHEVKIMSE
ncbi:hypothetical protein ACTFR8_23325 [Bacillus cereus group sp. MYBK15-3]|uniref:hypothetical protein n=1 Tax=unclassified Bacillus cereus group TaxID=2750818 RepID=UPI003F7ACDF9